MDSRSPPEAPPATDLAAREQALADRESFLCARERATGEHEAVVADREELLRLREDMVRARDEADEARAERERVMGQLRAANEQLVCTTVRAEELAELAQASVRAKDEFLAMLGHELRNPLAPIRTALELMELREPGVFARERELIGRQVGHMVRLVEDLLDVSRITSGKVELRHEPIRVVELIERAVETVEPLIHAKAHQLAVEIGPGDPMLFGDLARLTQVVGNLLANAAKYTPARGRIAVFAERAGETVVVRVRDTGIGIAVDMLPRVFDLFAQERQALARSQGGLGLGLAIARSLVELHGGSVTARSDGRGTGSEFEVRLPLYETAPGSGRAASRAAVRATVPRRILVVDDNVDITDVIAQVLENLGHEVRVAHDGPAALSAARTFAPQVALLDLGLPGMDGFELAAALRASPRTEPLRLIAMTGYGQPSDRVRTHDAGFDVHLVKPVDLPTLRGALDEGAGASFR